jgi:hypothetical protein
MPRYYFHCRGTDDQIVEDRFGSQHVDLDAVEHEATLLAREILEEEILEGALVLTPRCLEIENEAGEVVLYLPFWASVAVGQTAILTSVASEPQNSEPEL